MSASGSPAKRRKKNDTSSTPTKGPNLDFFFGKKHAPETPTSSSATDATILESEDPINDANLTDEELARRLHEQWEKEDALLFGRAKSATVAEEIKGSQSKDQEVEDLAFARSLQDAENLINEADKRNNKKGSDIPSDAKITKTDEEVNSTTAADSSSLFLGKSEDWEGIVNTLPFDQDPLTFDPKAFSDLFKSFPGGRTTYALLTRAFVLVNSTRSRIKIVDTLVNFLRTIVANDPESLLPAVWLTTNDIGPSYEETELGLGGSIISKALLKVGGITPAALRSLYHKYGDAGDVAFEAKVKQRTLQLRKPSPLSIKHVYASIVKISSSKGTGSQEIKQRIVERLLVDSRGEEVRYLTRTLVQHLRIGAVKTTMLIALSRAFLMTHPPDMPAPPKPAKVLRLLSKDARTEIYAGAEEIVKRCFAVQPNYNDLVPAMLKHGLHGVQDACKLGLHVPLKPMLGSITRDLGEMLGRLGDREFTAEYKYDGQRAQIHCDEKGKVSIFSRHLEKMTDKYPDLVALIPSIRGPNVTSFILEGEVVAIDAETGDLRTFQTLASRGRKDVAIGAVSITVCMYAFDLMYLNGKELLRKPFRERRRLLREEFIEVDKKFTWVKSLDTTADEQDAVIEFFKGSLELKCEGIMVKLLDNEISTTAVNEFDDLEKVEEVIAPETPSKKKKDDKTKETKKRGRRKPLLATYEPDKRLESWLKVKKDYDSSTDTLDVIPIAGWHGMGRKREWWSPILFAVRNPETGSLEAVCKCISGFTDVFYKENKERYSEDGDNTSREKKAYIEAADLRPAVWFEPQEVWEIVFADITLSPNYTAAIGLVSEERGLSLRFPRFLRRREDKSIEEASTSEQLAALYRKQEKSGKPAGDVDPLDALDGDMGMIEDDA